MNQQSDGWIGVDVTPHADFVWACSKEQGIVLAYFAGGRFQTAESAGDREGLSIEYYDDVTHWMPLQEPAAPLEAL